MKEWTASLLHNVRFYILIFSIILSLLIYFVVVNQFPDGPLRIIAITQYYALSAAVYLYLTLLVGPVVRLFPRIPYRGYIIKARRSLGVSVFYFAVLHSWNAFFKYLEGFGGIFSMQQSAQLAVLYASIALFIFFLMFLTATDWAIHKLGKNWKRLHRLIYIASFLVFLHATTLGHHFQSLGNWVAQVFILMLISLLFFHGWGLYKMFKRT